MRRARARNALRTLMPALAELVRVWEDEEDEGEDVGTEDGKNERVETGDVEGGNDGAVGNTSVVDKVCTAVGSEVSPSLVRAEIPHV